MDVHLPFVKLIGIGMMPSWHEDDSIGIYEAAAFIFMNFYMELSLFH